MQRNHLAAAKRSHAARWLAVCSAAGAALGLAAALMGVRPFRAPTHASARARPAAVSGAAADAGLDRLQSAMQGAVNADTSGSLYAVAVTDLSTGRTISVNGDRVQVSGCIANLFVLASTLKDVEDGQYSLASVRDLVTQTIWSSDADTAEQLYGITGGGDVLAGVRKVGALTQALGMSHTVIDHPPDYPWESLGIDSADDDLVTANDVNRGLTAIYDDRVLNSTDTNAFLDDLTRVEPSLDTLIGSTPGGGVSHKNGFLDDSDGWVDNDAGIVRFEAGGEPRAYAITFLSAKVPDAGDDVPLASRLAKMAWTYFSTAYGAASTSSQG